MLPRAPRKSAVIKFVIRNVGRVLKHFLGSFQITNNRKPFTTNAVTHRMQKNDIKITHLNSKTERLRFVSVVFTELSLAMILTFLMKM
jgi:hypothetical protein